MKNTNLKIMAVMLLAGVTALAQGTSQDVFQETPPATVRKIAPGASENAPGSRGNFLIAQGVPQGGGGGMAGTAVGGNGQPPMGIGGGFGGGVITPGQMAPPPSAGNFSSRLQSIIARASAGTSSGPLILRFSESDPTAQANLEEDMAVMGHILQRAAGEGGGNRAMGVDLVFTPGGEAKRDIYIEGYGFVFMVKVPFPLMAPAGKPESADQETKADSEWERAKREVTGQPPETVMAGMPSEPYREEKVEQLRDGILDALKNANNIRDLRAEDSVSVCVVGPSGTGPIPPRPPGALPPRAIRGAGTARVAPPAPARVENTTMMTIRVSKTDIENFAKGKTDLAGFRKAAKILAYGATSS